MTRSCRISTGFADDSALLSTSGVFQFSFRPCSRAHTYRGALVKAYPCLGEFCNGPASERAEGVVANILARLTREITEHCRERLTGTKAAREANSYRLFSAPFVATSKGLLYIKQSAKITV